MVILEDFTNDQFVVRPIVSAMMRRLGRPRASVAVCHEPRLRGIREALDWETIEEIVTLNRMVDLFLLCVDRDGQADRKAALEGIEARATLLLRAGQRFFAENAWQEIEVWVLAGHDLPREWNWREVWQEVNPKEHFFLPFARQRGVHGTRGGGRQILAEEAARRYGRIRRLCPELAALESRVQRWMKTTHEWYTERQRRPGQWEARVDALAQGGAAPG